MTLKTLTEIQELVKEISEAAQIAYDHCHHSDTIEARISYSIVSLLTARGVVCGIATGTSKVTFVLLKLQEGVFNVEIPRCTYIWRETGTLAAGVKFVESDIFIHHITTNPDDFEGFNPVTA